MDPEIIARRLTKKDETDRRWVRLSEQADTEWAKAKARGYLRGDLWWVINPVTADFLLYYRHPKSERAKYGQVVAFQGIPMCYVEELNEDLILLAHVGWPFFGQSDQL